MTDSEFILTKMTLTIATLAECGQARGCEDGDYRVVYKCPIALPG